MAIAAAGLIHPVVAALLMVGSSAFVSVRALRSGE
jgi:cation transport ATPase